MGDLRPVPSDPRLPKVRTAVRIGRIPSDPRRLARLRACALLLSLPALPVVVGLSFAFSFSSCCRRLCPVVPAAIHARAARLYQYISRRKIRRRFWLKSHTACHHLFARDHTRKAVIRQLITSY